MGPSDPKQELIALIADTFTVESLREFVRRGNKGADIEGRMSWAWAGLKELSAEFLEEAEKAKELHAELFSRVAAHAPHRVDEIVHLAEQLGHPWAPSVRALVLSGLLLEALPEDAQLALLPDIEQHLEKLGARPLAIRQAIGTRDTSNRINPRFFQSLLTQLPEHEATLTRVAALWQIDLRAPPPPPIKQMAQEALPIDLTDAPPSDPRHPAVLVLGSASVFPDHVARAAAAVGQALADLQLSLVTGDSSGVDLGVTRAFANRSRALGQPLRLLKVVTPSWPVTFEGGETLRRPDAAEASVARAALVLVFHGGDGTRQLHALAESMGKPILPLAATGPFAQELFDAQRAAGRLPGRLDARAFASLQELPEPGRFAPLLRRALPVAPGVAADHQPRRAPLTSDRPDQHEDLLDLASQARIFAEALSAKEVRPPLAIGLLGEWGSGKSFFMRQMQQQVRALTQSGDEAFHENVCQVEFNAWHYVDANPWASLAGRIFDGLAEHLFGSAQDQLEAKREALRARLVSTQTEERAARERHSEWQRRLEEARKRLHALEAAQQRYVRSAEVLLDRRVWQTVAERDSIGQLRGKAEEAAAALGLDVDIPEEQIPDELDRLKAQLEKARVATAQLRAVPGALGALGALRRPRGWLEWTLILLVLFGGLAVTLLLSFFEQPWWHQVATLLGQIVIILGFIGERAWKWVQASRAVVGFVEAADAEAEAIRQAILNDPPQELLDARAALAVAETETDAAREAVRDIEQRLAETRQEIEDIRAGKLAYDFIRGAGGEYVHQQGIVSKVRRDLETLQDRLDDWRREAQAAQEGEGDAPDVPAPIDRIILYIDDLDRCRPPQVVQVLQAVHLLLAFPLFMVVVGVDPRWLERSLESEYQAVLAGEGGASGALPGASPRDYLEKIFQVPFTLPAVDDRGFQRLVDRLLPSKEEAEAASSETPTPSTSSVPSSAHAPLPSGAAQAPLLQQRAAPPPLESEAPRFFIEAWEREHLHALAELVRTPRDIIRFINIYRLLRISAPNPKAFAEDRRDAEHRAAQLLLALNVGAPELAAGLLPLLGQPARLERLLGRVPERWREVVAALEPFTGDGGRRDSPLLSWLDGRQPRARAQLERCWPLLRDRVDQLPEDMHIWRRWAPRVARYSFLAGR